MYKITNKLYDKRYKKGTLVKNVVKIVLMD